MKSLSSKIAVSFVDAMIVRLNDHRDLEGMLYVNRDGGMKVPKKNPIAIGCVSMLALVLVSVSIAMCSSKESNSGKSGSNFAQSENKILNKSDPSISQPSDAMPDHAGACAEVICPAGTLVYSPAKNEGVAYGCQTEELSDYVDFVIGLLASEKTLGVKMPNIDPKTGEMETSGETKSMLDNLRSAAKINTFDEAMSHCLALRPKQRFFVLNYNPSRSSQWVSTFDKNSTFWVGGTYLVRRK